MGATELKDTEVTAEHEKAYSLVLIGGADANAITRKLARQLPFEATRNEIRVDGRMWKVKDSVLQAIYPSPLAADRYVYVITATSPEGMYFWKPQLVHFFMGYPMTLFDWVIQDGRRPPPGTQNAATAPVAAGLFDAGWRIVPQTGDVLEFVRHASGNVTGASVDSQGGVIWAKRLP